MKQLACKTCGSTDLLKLDGIFACQSCGCKYSAEEARKMMAEGVIDVSGSSVKIDEASKEYNYFRMAENAEEAGKYKEMELYCRKALEINAKNPEIWRKRGDAVFCQSTLASTRIAEMTACYNETIRLLKLKGHRDLAKTRSAFMCTKLYLLSIELFNQALKNHVDKVTPRSASTCLRILKEIQDEILPFFKLHGSSSSNHYEERLKAVLLMGDKNEALPSPMSGMVSLDKETLNWMKLTGKSLETHPQKRVEYVDRATKHLLVCFKIFEFTKNLSDEDIRRESSGELTGEDYKRTQVIFLKAIVQLSLNTTAVPEFPNLDIVTAIRNQCIHNLKEIDPSYTPLSQPSSNDNDSNRATASEQQSSGKKHRTLDVVCYSIILIGIIGTLYILFTI